MNKSMITGVVLGGFAATALGTFAGYKYMAPQEPQFAEVLNVEKITESYTVPREECEDREVTKTREVKDERQLAGTALGAVVGGLLGNQIGGGTGKKLATVAGAAAGGYAGKRAQENMQQQDTYTEIERICSTVQDKKQKLVGYDVKYRLGEVVSMVRMDHQPGEQIPVRDGELILTQGAAK